MLLSSYMSCAGSHGGTGLGAAMSVGVKKDSVLTKKNMGIY